LTIIEERNDIAETDINHWKKKRSWALSEKLDRLGRL
jgi:hypothetical protein